MPPIRGSLTATPSGSTPPAMDYSDGAMNGDGSPLSFTGLEKARPEFSCFEGKPGLASRLC
jgi:hypothetical protein